MKEKAKFLIGSKVFFNNYSDFKSKDEDYLYIMDNWDVKSNILNFRKDGVDRFFIKDTNKQDMINDVLHSDVPMRAGKFLVPSFVEYIGATVEDIKQLAPVFEKVDEKHTYEKVIYDAYITNDGFVLTDEQRNAAYEEYKK